MESGEERQKRGSGGNNINSLPAPPPPSLQPHRCFSAHFSVRRPHYFGPVHTKVGEPRLSIKSPPPFKPIAVFLLTFLCTVPTFLDLFTWKWGNPGCPSNPSPPPPPFQLHRCFSAHFSFRCPHHFGPVYLKVREPGLSIKSPLQPYRCFSAHFALSPLFWACLH